MADMTRNDPFSYLHRSGFTSSGIKKGTERRTPETLGAHAGVKEAPGGTKARAASPSKGVEQQAPKVEKATGLAKRANIEGNESKKYEALEKKSLRSLKHGGSEKELRDGHNLSLGNLLGGGGGSSGPSPQERRATAVKALAKKERKTGSSGVDAALNPGLAARVERRVGVQAAKKAGGDVKAAKAAGNAAIHDAKLPRVGMSSADKKASRQSYNKILNKYAPKPKSGGGGGIMGKVMGAGKKMAKGGM